MLPIGAVSEFFLVKARLAGFEIVGGTFSLSPRLGVAAPEGDETSFGAALGVRFPDFGVFGSTVIIARKNFRVFSK
jgi:hypothetical protein